MNNYLKDLNLTDDQIDEIVNNNLKIILEKLKTKQKLITININFLEDLGITNTKDIFVKYTELFLLEPSIFKNKFLQYNKDDLINRLSKNIDIVTLL